MSDKEREDEVLEALGKMVREDHAGAPDAPLSEEEIRAITARAMASIAAARKPPRRIPWARRAAFGGAIAALAAGIAVAVLVRAPEALPPYTMELRGGLAAERGSAPAGEVVELARGAPFEILLRPDVAWSAPLEVRAVLVRGAEVRAWTPPIAGVVNGVVQIRGVAGRDLELPPGDWELIVAVAPAGSAPPAAELAEGRAGGPWRVVRGRLRALR